ncbi:hypothetical protein CHLNCDRAFT_35190 [Chlorella variabilis]|uniref:Acyl-[acyl-carrier-protein] desaturase n=1 Tax=Chlorella variabilis TaxID=554065 RepID=E1ZCJ2_CHLVA|nr:hypothetical protein CHLNCDRAFT_35190 [Chlorella variabilis]EFN56251.1 hypothetical protein CHLNCDRAFT_35190 [Chlorella variabilis]|eukprot:XP_005848353.1 hypothetical protein CHLNCDRAFT_35190 [Chlorella variabilis]
MVALSAGVNVAPSSQHIASCGALRQSRSTAAPRRAAAVVRPRAVAAPEAAARQGPTIVNGQVLHSATKEQLDVVASMDKYAEEHVLPILKPVEKCWQAQDFLPHPESPDFLDHVHQLQQRTKEVPDDYFVCLVGDMITEEALPTYMAMLNTLDGVRDETGAAPTPWGRWTRQWVAEENRHGDLMNKYCWLSGRVDLRQVEVTIQNLIGSGMDPKTENNPYLGFIYTSFQERATKVSHGNTARMAAEYGDEVLGKVCGAIASDESRHEIAYTRIVDEFFRQDPNNAMLCFADMMRKQIVMPAHLMDDGKHGILNGGRNLFTDFSEVAERLGVYQASDYCDIMEHLVARWDIEHREGLRGEAAEAQEYLMKLPTRFRKLSERAAARKSKAQPARVQFSWIFNREVKV